MQNAKCKMQNAKVNEDLTQMYTEFKTPLPSAPPLRGEDYLLTVTFR
jgi:hypothetical protein